MAIDKSQAIKLTSANTYVLAAINEFGHFTALVALCVHCVNTLQTLTTRQKSVSYPGNSTFHFSTRKS